MTDQTPARANTTAAAAGLRSGRRKPRYVLFGCGGQLAELMGPERRYGQAGWRIIPLNNGTGDGYGLPAWVGHVTAACMDLWQYRPECNTWTRHVARCTVCGRNGVPYTYRDMEFSGLCAYRGERLCPACRDARLDADGVDILVIDDRPSIPDRVYNTARDRDLAPIWVPPERRGIDGRDGHPRRRPPRG